MLKKKIAVCSAQVPFVSGGAELLTAALIRELRKRNYDVEDIKLPYKWYNQFTENELAEWGANIIIYANHMLRASYPAMVKCAETILKAERSLEVNDICMPIKQILELIPGTK